MRGIIRFFKRILRRKRYATPEQARQFQAEMAACISKAGAKYYKHAEDIYPTKATED